MSGQLIDRGGGRKWLVRVYVGKVKGQRKYVSKTVHGPKRDAQRVLTRMLSERDQGTLRIPTQTTLAEYLENWKESSLKGRVSARTYAGYADNLKRYVLGPLGEKRLTSLEPWDIQQIYNGMRDRGLSGTTVRRTHAALRSALKQAVRWGILPSNPADAVDLPSVGRPKHYAMTQLQARKFLKLAEASSWRALYHVMLVCGLRPGEAFGLTWKAVDLAKGHLAVLQAVTYDADKKACLAEPKTKRSRRSMPIPPALVEVLLDHKERTQGIGNPLDLVFPNAEGHIIHPNHWPKREFKDLVKKAGLPKEFRVYDLRHTCATLMLEVNTHVKIVSERLGHASTQLTLDTYSHVTPTMQDTATAALASMVYAPVNEEAAALN